MNHFMVPSTLLKIKNLWAYIICRVNQQLKKCCQPWGSDETKFICLWTQCEVTWLAGARNRRTACVLTVLAPGDSKPPSRASHHHWREAHTGERRQYLFQRSGLLYYSPAVNVNSSGLVWWWASSWTEYTRWCFSGVKLRRKAELFGPVTLPNAVHVLSCNELHQKNYFRTLSWKNTCDFTASCRYARG